MKTAAVMLQGTGSNVGKSLIVAGLCRAFARRGLAVRPFKPQNMSNNAAATADGGEIGRAQALQARAAGVASQVHFNPVLLKPETDTGAQVIVHGRRIDTWGARDFRHKRRQLLGAVMDSFNHLEEEADLVLIEGAGSPAEINLRDGDIANMGFAVAADVPVVLIGDIDRGGVIASLVGTHAVLTADERDRIKGFLINRFRGDASLFDDGLTAIEAKTGWPPLGVIGWFEEAGHLPEEDSPGLLANAPAPENGLKIVVPLLSRMANFDDLDPLRMEGDVGLTMLRPGEALPGDTDIVLLAGSKSTIGDLHYIRQQGWDIDILAHHRRGGTVIGLCGGYQMLGLTIADPGGLEGMAQTIKGLGLLDVETVLTAEKTVRPAAGHHMSSGVPVEGYEIHLGETNGPDCARPVVELGGRADGAMSKDGLVWGTYLHGLFASDEYRRQYLADFATSSDLAFEVVVEKTLEKLADHLEASADIDGLLGIAQAR